MNETRDNTAAPGAKAPVGATSSTMSYGEYLRLDRILEAQDPLSPDRNEMLFIIQHQTSELWMKLMLHELKGAIAALAADELPPAFKMLARVSASWSSSSQAWSVLATMTPTEYAAFRPLPRPVVAASSRSNTATSSSGWATRSRAMLEPHARSPGVARRVGTALLRAPSLYDESHAPFWRAAASPVTARSCGAISREQLPPNASVQAAWTEIYREPGSELGSVRARRGARRSRGRLPPMALPPRHHGRAHHRLQARHGRHGRRRATCARCSTSCCSRSCGGCGTEL